MSRKHTARFNSLSFENPYNYMYQNASVLFQKLL
jgi:hypothetical protein